MWIEVDNSEIAALNFLSPIHKIIPVKTIDGKWVVNSDVLTEPVFEFAIAYLNTCPTLNDVQFPIPKMP